MNLPKYNFGNSTRDQSRSLAIKASEKEHDISVLSFVNAIKGSHKRTLLRYHLCERIFCLKCTFLDYVHAKNGLNAKKSNSLISKTLFHQWVLTATSA